VDVGLEIVPVAAHHERLVRLPAPREDIASFGLFEPVVCDLADVVSLGEIATLLHVHTRTARRYTERQDFSEPIARLGAGRIWLRSDVQAWADRTLPLRQGRPRKT
jgi:hypothetical protein